MRPLAAALLRRALAVGASVLVLIGGLVVYSRSSIDLPHSGNAVRAAREEPLTLTRTPGARSTTSLLELRDQSGFVTTVWLREPLDPAADYKILLTYVGHKTGREILDLIPERDDVVLAAMQYPVEYNATWREKLMLPATLSAVAGDTVTGGMLAVSELQDRGLDIDRLTVVGVSFGSHFAILHGAYDELVPRVLIIHGGGGIRGILTSMYDHRGRPWTGRLLGSLGSLLLGPLDPEHHVARLAPRSFTLIATRGDQVFPEQGVQLLYERARPPKALVWNEGAHVSSRRLDIVSDLIVQIEAYLDGRLEFDESESLP